MKQDMNMKQDMKTPGHMKNGRARGASLPRNGPEQNSLLPDLYTAANSIAANSEG